MYKHSWLYSSKLLTAVLAKRNSYIDCELMRSLHNAGSTAVYEQCLDAQQI
jgi:hypothetical protein